MQINSKIVSIILLHVKNMQKPACAYSAASQAFQLVILLYHIESPRIIVNQAKLTFWSGQWKQGKL